MDLHSKLKKAGIPHSCSECCRKCKNSSEPCGKFYPENMQQFLDNITDFLRDTVEPSKKKFLGRHPVSDRTSYDDKVTPLDKYYVLLINSVLSAIRHGSVDYVFDFEQIKEIIRFERDISVKYIPDAGAFEISKRS